MLVLVDGPHVYWNFYGIILWDSFPINMEDIKRIETIRGAGSTLYEANAFRSVINIIIKTPEESKKTHVSVTGDNFNTYLNSIIHTENYDRYSYKFSLQWYFTNLMVYSVGETKKNETRANEKVDPYMLVNLRLGYKFLKGTIEIGMSIYNLFDKRHFEYPGTNNQGNPSGAYQIGRRITGIFMSHTF